MELNKEKYKNSKKKWIEKNNNYQKEYRKKNIEKQREYFKNYRKNERNTKVESLILARLRTILNILLKNKNIKKHSKMNDNIGCSILELKIHLEKQFKPGMSWENKNKWHIDHIIPCASFDLTNLEEQKKCFHYTNLQPLWAIDNLRKGKKIL